MGRCELLPAVDLCEGRRVFTDTMSLGPSRQAARVTREVAMHLAELARALEGAGHAPEQVARFLMRCVFTMFAEHFGLSDLRFTRMLAERWIPEPGRFSCEVVDLWTEVGQTGAGLFRDVVVVPLARADLEKLLVVAKCDWKDVEPAIFGALIERALDPRERHRLGAHYTPRAYVERLVRPTIEAPLREAWSAVLGVVRRLVPRIARRCGDAGRGAMGADDGRCRRRRVPADAGTPGHVLGASVRQETTRGRAAIGPRRHRLREMIARRLRALSRGPARLRPTVGTACRPGGIVGAPLIERSELPRARTGAKKCVELAAASPGRMRDELEEARALVRGFHQRLCAVRVLDPACGSGNFLYVTLDLIKELEGEVLGVLRQLGAKAEGMVTLAQFLGIEKKRWASEIAELVLWIGFLQWYARTRRYADGSAMRISRGMNTNIECRDALLLWDGERPVLDVEGRAVTRWDGFTTKRHAVSGDEVPDEYAQVPVIELVAPRRAEWPRADFIVGNPPFIGNKRMRLALGDGYVEALRRVYGGVPENVDLVMYWWHRAAEEVGAGRASRFGFVTTNSITQSFNRRVLTGVLRKYEDLRIAFAVPDHPWVDSADGAAVRIAMTCVRAGGGAGQLLKIVAEGEGEGAERDVRFVVRNGGIHADLTCGVDLASVRRLEANRGLSCPGVQLSGQGFVVDPEQARGLTPRTREALVRGYVTGRDLVQRRRGLVVLDTFGLAEAELARSYPDAYQHLLDRVKPERLQNPREKYRRDWWLHSEPRSRFRGALVGLPRFIATSRTARHRVFQFLDGATLAETKVLVLAFADAFMLGVLSSRVHVVFATARGGWLGVGNDSTYNHSDCFDTFPFPDATEPQRAGIRALAEELDAHRKARQAEHPGLTMTGVYNVLERLRAGEGLSDKEATIHAQGLVSVLRQLHEDLDAAVLAAYGWPTSVTDEEILGRLVELNARRAEEERGGLVRWLRPDLQGAGGERAQ